jgi:tRNA(Ile)-lysidine synthase
MEDLLTRVRRYASRYGLLPAEEKVVVGVSGGPDSLALLHLLRRLSPELGLGLHVAHLNHGLRGAAAGEDARFVADLAQRWGLPCTVGQVNVRSLAVGRSLEEAARLARYRFLAEVAGDAGGSRIAVGHNADDQAETVLMHILRGTGVAGLRGMLPSTTLADYRLDAPYGGPLRLVRPLLGIRRRDIEHYCAEHALQPRFDRSNEDLTFYRNRLRHELLPILEGYNPAIRDVLAHTAEVLAGDGETLRTALEAAWLEVALPAQPGEVLFDLPKWRALALGQQRATLRRAIHVLCHELRDINWEHVERAVWLARSGRTGQAATLARGLTLEIGYRDLRVAGKPRDPGENGGDAPWIAGLLPLNAPGVTPLERDWQVIVRMVEDRLAPFRGGGSERRWEAWLDAEAVGAHLVLRPRRPGDRFHPQGMGGHSVKLSEFMINEKVLRSARAGWPVLEGANGVAWVCGLRLDERAVVKEAGRAAWHVRFVRNPDRE